MDEVRCGVIGVGMMGRLHAANIARLSPAARLVAIADVSAAACAETVARVPLEGVYEDYRQMLALAEINAVVICTPPDLHGEMIQAAANAGKHVFCEKPLGCDLIEIDRALGAIARAGVKLQVGFNRRFDAGFRRAQHAVSTGEIGRLLRLHLTSRDPVRAPGETPVFDPDMFLDTTVHDLDMARFVSGSEAASVYVVASERAEAVPSPAIALVVLSMENGVIVSIDNSWLSSYGYDQRLEAFGSEGMIRVENELPHRARLSNAAGESLAAPLRFFTQRYADSYVAEMTAFVECVRQDSAAPVSGEDGRAAVLLALAARQSWREGRPVAVSES